LIATAFMDHAQLIRDLGGGSVVGAWLRDRGIKVEDVTVRSWTHEGRSIPDGYWAHIKDMADEKAVPCSFEALAKSVAIEPRAAA
jgi:hypothetical protein